MTDDTSKKDNCRIELICSVDAKVTDFGKELPQLIGDRLARIQNVIEQAIAQELQIDPIRVSAEVRYRLSNASSESRRRRGSGPTSKKDMILELLQSKDGATTKVLQQATGWKPNTVSAQLDYLSKTGHTISRSRQNGVLRYRLA